MRRDAVAVAERLRRALEAPFEIDGHPSLRLGADRHRGQHHRLHQGRRDPPRRQHRAQSRVDLSLGALRNLRSGDAAARHDAAESGNRSASRHRQPRLRAALSADHLAARRAHRRVRSAGALAPPGARAAAADRLHRRGRGHRHDRRHRPADAGGVVPADGGVGDRLRRRGAGRDVRQRLEQAARRQGVDEPDCRGAATPPASRPAA